jgi:hypothetical protein
MKSIERTPTPEELNSQSEAERTDERMNRKTICSVLSKAGHRNR